MATSRDDDTSKCPQPLASNETEEAISGSMHQILFFIFTNIYDRVYYVCKVPVFRFMQASLSEGKKVVDIKTRWLDEAIFVATFTMLFTADLKMNEPIDATKDEKLWLSRKQMRKLVKLLNRSINSWNKK